MPGTFACTGTGACTITPNAVTGALTLSGTGVLNFSPEDGNAVISRARSDYLYFGYWLHKPTAPSGAHRFSVVSGGSDPFDVRDEGESTVHALSGRASYSGSAAGKYVTRDLTAGTARIGQFTATASLSADFNATASWAKKVAADAAANADEDLTIAGAVMTNVAGAGMVSGTITDFMEGDEPLHNWHVRLDGAGLAAIGQAEHSVAVDATDGSLTVTAMDGTGMTASGESTTQFTSSVTARVGAAADIPGQWVGRFYGNDGRTADRKPLPVRLKCTPRTLPLPALSAHTTRPNNPTPQGGGSPALHPSP